MVEFEQIAFVRYTI